MCNKINQISKSKEVKAKCMCFEMGRFNEKFNISSKMCMVILIICNLTNWKAMKNVVSPLSKKKKRLWPLFENHCNNFWVAKRPVRNCLKHKQYFVQGNIFNHKCKKNHIIYFHQEEFWLILGENRKFFIATHLILRYNRPLATG